MATDTATAGRPPTHLSRQLAANDERVAVMTRYGTVIGGKALNGAFAFLGESFVDVTMVDI